MKKLTALALIAFGWVAVNPALAQQMPSTADDHFVLAQKAADLGNSKLQKQLHRFKPIALWKSEDHPRGRVGDESIYVPGDIKGIDWDADRAQTIRVVITNSPAILTVHDLEELKKRKRELIATGVMEAPVTQETKGEGREGAASSQPSSTSAASNPEPTDATPSVSPEPAAVTPATPEQQPTTPAAPTPSPTFAGKSPKLTEKPSKPAATDHSVLGWVVFAVVVLLIIIVRSRKLSAEPEKLGRARDGYEEARTGVPHAGFRRTKKGFEVALKNKGSRYDGCLSLFRSHPDNRIEVTEDTVIINKKRYRKSNFGGFIPGVVKQSTRSVDPEHVLYFNYGGESYAIPGVWKEQEANEIILALNLHVREFSQAGPSNPNGPSHQAGPKNPAGPGNQDPERLRNNRPTDF